MTAHFEAAYTLIRGFETVPAAEATLRIRRGRPASAIMSGRNSRVTYIGARALMSMVRAMSRSGAWSQK